MDGEHSNHTREREGKGGGAARRKDRQWWGGGGGGGVGLGVGPMGRHEMSLKYCWITKPCNGDVWKKFLSFFSESSKCHGTIIGVLSCERSAVRAIVTLSNFRLFTTIITCLFSLLVQCDSSVRVSAGSLDGIFQKATIFSWYMLHHCACVDSLLEPPWTCYYTP